MAEELEQEGPEAAVHGISSQEAARNEMGAATLLPFSICTVQDLSQEMASPTLGRFSQVSQDTVGGPSQLSEYSQRSPYRHARGPFSTVILSS